MLRCYSLIKGWSHTTGGLLKNVTAEKHSPEIKVEDVDQTWNLTQTHFEVYVWRQLPSDNLLWSLSILYILQWKKWCFLKASKIYEMTSRSLTHRTVPRKAASIAAFWHASLPSLLCYPWLGQRTRPVGSQRASNFQTKLPGNPINDQMRT